MAITSDRVREIFKGLETGDGAAFFEHVADDVDWTVMGTHPLAGRYACKQAFKEGTFAKLGKVLPQGAQLNVEHLFVQGDEGSWSFALWRRPKTACVLTTTTAGSCISCAMKSCAFVPTWTRPWSPACSKRIRSNAAGSPIRSS